LAAQNNETVDSASPPVGIFTCAASTAFMQTSIFGITYLFSVTMLLDVELVTNQIKKTDVFIVNTPQPNSAIKWERTPADY